MDSDGMIPSAGGLHELKGRSWDSFFSEPYSPTAFEASSKPSTSRRGHVMRIPEQEMDEYGILPETDPFIVVVCGVCKAAVKPQGLKKHIHRHNTASTGSDLANLITPCSVSVSALKYDPKADNSNSSTSSVYNTGPGVTESTSSSSCTSTSGVDAFQDFTAISNSSAGLGEIPAPCSSSTSNTALASSGGKQPQSVSSGSLKIKLSKAGVKTSSSSSNSSSSSTSSRSASVEPSSFLDATSVPIKSSLRNSEHPNAFNRSSPPLINVKREEQNSLSSSLGSLNNSSSSSCALTLHGKKQSLKEREYDPNKHCGVVLAESGKPCTRTLTCKSHALSLRRQVSGRSMSFDQLLSDHRAMRAAVTGGKPPPTLPPPSSLPPPPPLENSNQNSNSSSTSSSSNRKRELREPDSPEPPAKKLQLERTVLSRKNHHHHHSHHHHHHHHNHHRLKEVKSEPVDPDDEPLVQPFRESTTARSRGAHGVEYHEGNGFGGGQLVEKGRSFQQHQFVKAESQLAVEGVNVKHMSLYDGKFVGDCDLMLAGTEMDEKLKEIVAPPPASIITVPLTMLANVMCVNGRNCILEPPPATPGEGAEEEENVIVDGLKGRHVEVVVNNTGSGAGGVEKRRYFTLSSGRQQRATNRLRLNVIRTEEVTSGGGAEKNGEESAMTAQDYPGIDTWFHQIPKPTYVNCFKLCKLGSGAVLSKRYLNIRKSLIMNMSQQSLGAAAAGGGGGGVASGVQSPGVQQVLNRSNSQSLGGGGSPVSGVVEKVNNFSVERIKV